MDEVRKYPILNVMINAIDYDATVNQILEVARAGKSFGFTALAVHGLMVGTLNRQHLYRLNSLDLVVPDGQPVRWALNILYRTALEHRVYGPTVMLHVCERAEKEQLPIYLYGSTSQILEDLKLSLLQKFPHLIIAGQSASLFRTVSEEEDAAICEMINQSGAKIVFIGLGCPRQEVWVYEHLRKIHMPMLAVGAAFAFHSGHLAQAPSFLQDLGLEWLFRLTQQPRKLWQRYLFYNPLFLVFFLLQILHLYPSRTAIAPTQDIRFG